MPSPSGTTIRLARPTDAAALRAILYDTYESTWLPQVTAGAARAFHEKDRPAAYIAARAALFWVAEEDGAVAGFVDWEGDLVNALHVHSSQARRGLGGRLVDKAEFEIARAGFAAARLETDTFNQRSQAF